MNLAEIELPPEHTDTEPTSAIDRMKVFRDEILNDPKADFSPDALFLRYKERFNQKMFTDYWDATSRLSMMEANNSDFRQVMNDVIDDMGVEEAVKLGRAERVERA